MGINQIYTTSPGSHKDVSIEEDRSHNQIQLEPNLIYIY